ncbi:unnamed protein product [Rotaria socialis]|uniref:Palmitoyltransferase n=1 Tax=Rotaria socialis TaxID=392032 RepID=A0A818S4S2_9BILA|nr:unnamed protein product [Rotaria socialis]CAF3449362.1 unnamed protein product [Rotaria socialis]CAF3566111.1 unnamed protein product [Rotaria socialis]CAF3660973.1 unnamed protein product [Rotaria socialis]CAF4106844.1 unnamed protein product [Rotaria socialis]
MKSSESNQTNSGNSKPPLHLVEGANMVIDPPIPDPYTADLVSAVQYGYYDRVVELIEPEPNLASTSVNDGITLLHWAAINNRIEIAKYLISKQVEIDVFGGELKSTPLHWAIRDRKLKMIVYLLSQNAQASLFDGEGFASIHLATMFGYTDVIAYLVAKGHDVDLLDKHGMTPLMHAARRIGNRELTQVLIRLGAEVNYQNPVNKFTALHYAIHDANLDAVKILLDAGAKVDIRNSDNETAYELEEKQPKRFHIRSFLLSRRVSNPHLPKCLQLNSSYRRLGTKLLPYFILIIIAFIFQYTLPIIYKFILLFTLFLLAKGYSMIFFDDNVDRYLPIAIAQASIFCLYACYLYYFLEYVHVISWSFLCLIILTYFSWKNYYLSQKCDPGIITENNREQSYRVIIQLIEQNLFGYETFCMTCLVRRPMRSKHCRDCDKCIAKFDHHCPWIDNCVGEKNLGYFTGFIFFTPLCLYLYFYGAYLYYYYHCNLFSSETIIDGIKKMIDCTPAVLWFTSIAILHTIWIGGLCISILYQIATGYTTNEKFNAWRYKHLKLKDYSPFSLGCKQNLVDLINRRILWYIPVTIDWTRIYSLDDFYQALPLKIRQKLNISSVNSSVDLYDV